MYFFSWFLGRLQFLVHVTLIRSLSTLLSFIGSSVVSKSKVSTSTDFQLQSPRLVQILEIALLGIKKGSLYFSGSYSFHPSSPIPLSVTYWLQSSPLHGSATPLHDRSCSEPSLVKVNVRLRITESDLLGHRCTLRSYSSEKDSLVLLYRMIPPYTPLPPPFLLLLIPLVRDPRRGSSRVEVSCWWRTRRPPFEPREFRFTKSYSSVCPSRTRVTTTSLRTIAYKISQRDVGSWRPYVVFRFSTPLFSIQNNYIYELLLNSTFTKMKFYFVELRSILF